jgi:hypothetical protein
MQPQDKVPTPARAKSKTGEDTDVNKGIVNDTSRESKTERGEQSTSSRGSQQEDRLTQPEGEDNNEAHSRPEGVRQEEEEEEVASNASLPGAQPGGRLEAVKRRFADLADSLHFLGLVYETPLRRMSLEVC